MDIFKLGARPTRRAPSDHFTGEVLMDPILEGTPPPARVRSLNVAFAPGARSHWHTHPLGQTLYVISGCGRAQTMGAPVREIRAGDVVWIPPGEKHWHGAGPETSMVHIAVSESLDGNSVQWMEKVTDEEFKAKAEK